jgi:hypothetical protein
MRQAAFAVVLLTALAQPAGATDFSTGGTFLQLGHGARAHGLGGAGTVLFRDDSAVYWNAANLAWLSPRLGATFMHASILPGITDGYQTGSVAHAPGQPLGTPEQSVRPRRFGLGLFVSHLGFDFESGSTWGETVLLIGAGYAFTNFASVGLGVKGLQVSNDFESADASGAGLDLSLSVLVTDRLSAAIVGTDVWTRVRWDTSRWETLSAAMTLGFEYRLAARWTVVADVVVRESATQRLSLGGEWQAFRQLLFLRAGMTSRTPGESRNYPSFGAGVRAQRFLVDYGVSFDSDDGLETGHRFSLGIQF